MRSEVSNKWRRAFQHDYKYLWGDHSAWKLWQAFSLPVPAVTTLHVFPQGVGGLPVSAFRGRAELHIGIQHTRGDTIFEFYTCCDALKESKAKDSTAQRQGAPDASRPSPYRPQAALLWCVTVQECSVYLDWPSSALKQWPQEEVGGRIVFRGPR
jgi:hypothetical protein